MTDLTWYPLPTEPCLGTDQDGRLVLNGAVAFKITSTDGLPLELILMDLHAKGWTIHWPTFVVKASLEGWNPRTIYARIEEALHGVYRDEVESHKLMEKLDLVFDTLKLPRR